MPYSGDYLLLGSFAGAPTEPQRVKNVENASEVTVETGTGTKTMTATVLRDLPALPGHPADGMNQGNLSSIRYMRMLMYAYVDASAADPH